MLFCGDPFTGTSERKLEILAGDKTNQQLPPPKDLKRRLTW
jgi:hypothetical protein